MQCSEPSTNVDRTDNKVLNEDIEGENGEVLYLQTSVQVEDEIIDTDKLIGF